MITNDCLLFSPICNHLCDRLLETSGIETLRAYEELRNDHYHEFFKETEKANPGEGPNDLAFSGYLSIQLQTLFIEIKTRAKLKEYRSNETLQFIGNFDSINYLNLATVLAFEHLRKQND